MIEITNITRGPVQLVVRTGPGTGRNFTVLNIPGIGAKNNVREIEDERAIGEYIKRHEEAKLIRTRRVTKKASK